MVFLEDPTPILVIGIVLEAVLAIVLVRTGRGVLLAPMVGVALLVLAGLGIERWVVTDKERVEMTIDEAAAAVEANDLDRLLACISSSSDAQAAETRREAQRIHDLVEFTQLRLRNLEITVNRHGAAPKATASFLAIVTGRVRTSEFGAMGELTRPAELSVDLRQESGRWVIVGHRFVRDPREQP